MSKNTKRWTFQDALQFVRLLNDEVKEAGFYVAMTGSVLFEGHSDNDLDLIIYPKDSTWYDLESLKEVLCNLDMEQRCSRALVAKVWERKGTADTKHVEKWRTKDKKTVDLFFLR